MTPHTQQNITPQLALPSCDIALRRDAGGRTRIYDPLRGRWIVLTPEEWVRQHFVGYMMQTLGVPRSFMANEVSLTLNGTRRRCDTVVFTRSLRPLCIVEYKRPSVEITSAVFDQVARYNSVHGAPFLMVSNGLRHYCCRYDASAGYTFLRELPTYGQMLGAVTK